jgi:hypothetical protein
MAHIFLNPTTVRRSEGVKEEMTAGARETT